MNMENIIKIKGGSYTDVKKALRQWIHLYSDNLDKSLTFELYKNGQGNHLIKTDDRLDNENFFFLVNYLKYPENIDYKISIEGYTYGKDYKEFINQNILVYIAQNDTDYDTVNVVTQENKIYKVDFGGKIKEVSDNISYSSFNVPDLSNPETLRVTKPLKKDKDQETIVSPVKVEKRFKIISIIALIIIAGTFLIFSHDRDLFVTITFFTGMGIGGWFFIDFKMLRIDKFYIFSLFVAGLYLGYGILLKSTMLDNVELIDLGSLFAVSFLIVQKPVRLLYKQIFKREPEIVNQGDSSAKFWDIVYTIILFLSLVIIPFLLTDKIN